MLDTILDVGVVIGMAVSIYFILYPNKYLMINNWFFKKFTFRYKNMVMDADLCYMMSWISLAMFFLLFIDRIFVK